jgi:NaMN:DMB phosphoribosyltransferase
MLETLLFCGGQRLRLKILHSDTNGESAWDIAIRRQHHDCQAILEEGIDHLRNQGETIQFLVGSHLGAASPFHIQVYMHSF